MKNEALWQPTKFVMRRGRLAASHDQRYVRVPSRLMAGLVARCYDTHVPNYVCGRLLDLGCGLVPLYAVYRQHAGSVVCVDWGNSLHGRQHLDYELDITQPLPFEAGAFDTIILSDVLEHIPNPEALWREMTRLLAPGGRILLNVPFLYWVHEGPHDFYRYTEFALRRFAELCGLRLLVMEPYGGALEVLTDIFAKCVRQVPVLGRPVAAVSQSLTSWFGGTGLGRRASRATGAYFPSGYFLVAEKPAASS